MLTENRYKTYTAYTAEEALEVLKDLQPKLILVDIGLPGMDGLMLTKFLKKQARYKDVPIIAITAYAMKGDEEKAVAAGCSGYIAKPFDTRSFPGLIDQYLHK